MAAPKWKTPKGNLGTIQEQEYYELALEAIVVDDSNPSLTYKIIAGALPPGLVLNETTGTINGRSKELYRFRGVPFNVSEDVTSTFCCRVTNTKTGQVSDRTFSLTVTGQDAPVIVSNVEELGEILDGDYAEFQITAIDLDNEKLKYYITNGTLPSGMSLNESTGLISGIVEPEGYIDANQEAGWSSDTVGWDEEPWQFYARVASKRYVFDVNVTDGKDTVSKKFGIFVISKSSLTADNDLITASGYYDVVTSDIDGKRTPVLLSTETDIGTYTHLNYFAYQFKAVDFDGDEVAYSILLDTNVGFDNELNGFDTILYDTGNLSLPVYLTMSAETGWLYGELGRMDGIQAEYEFAIFVYKKDYPEYKSKVRTYKMTVVGDLQYYINWITPSDLGTIVAGGPSELAIEAESTYGKQLLYSLKIGSKSRLPQGLRLLENGLISGRPSFEVTSFDDSKLTFDTTIRIGDQLLPETTFDREYTFTVKAKDIDDTLTAYKTFKVKVLSEYTRPYEALYLRAQPGLADKEIYNQIIYNTDIIPTEYVYRLGDPYYGKQSNLEVLLLSGINPSEPHEYIEAMVINHYRKKLMIGEPQIARALDDNGNVKYEVLYLPIKDDNATVSKSIDLTKKINRQITTDRTYPNMDLTYFTVDGYDKIVYPNSLRSMRQQIRDTLGYVDREVLPDWMTSKQEDGKIPYWTPALVLAYLKPDTGKKVKFLMDRVFTYDLKDISFEVDRYVWDCNLSKVYNANTDHYYPSRLTTFDTVIKLAAEPLVFTFIGNGESTGFDLGSQQSDFDADISDDATIVFDSPTITEKTTVSYTLTGIDDDALAEVIFTDTDTNSVTVSNLFNGTHTVNLNAFVDGIVTATITVRDLSNNTAIGTGDTALIPTPQVNITLATLEDLEAVEYTIAGVDANATARVVFADVGGTQVEVTGLTNGSYTINLVALIDGIITASITATDTITSAVTPGTSDTALAETVKCILCSAIEDNNAPSLSTFLQTGIAASTDAYVDKQFSVVDWEAKQIHQFLTTGDDKLYCITIDAETMTELFRSESVSLTTAYFTGRTLTYIGYDIDRLIKIPGTDWIFMSIWDTPTGLVNSSGMSLLTYNVVTGATNYYDPSQYPVSDDYYNGLPPVSKSNGSNPCKPYWAKPLGTNSGKSLACARITNEGYYNDFIDQAGYSLFIIDNTTGAMSCIAYGDFGDIKTHTQAYEETISGDCTPTVVGSNYTEFVYYVPKIYTNIPPDKWGDKTWFYAYDYGTVRNYTSHFDTYSAYKAYFYKVRVTTDGTITWNYVSMLEDTTVPDFTSLNIADGQTVFIHTARIVSVDDGSYNPAITFYDATTNEVNIVVPLGQDGVYTQYGNYYNYFNQSINGTAIFKLNLDTGAYTRTNVDCTTMPVALGYYNSAYESSPYPTVHNMSEPKILVAKVDSTLSTSNMDTGAVSQNVSFTPTSTYVLNCADGTVEPWVIDTNAGFDGGYSYNLQTITNTGFIDIPNCRLYFIDWWYALGTEPYGQTALVQYVRGPKKLVETTYIAVKVGWPGGTLPANTITYTNIDQNVCTSPTLSTNSYYQTVVAGATGTTDKYATAANIQIQIDSTSIRKWDNTLQQWVSDTNNEISYTSGVLSATVPYFETHPMYAAHARFVGYGFDMNYTVPGSTQKFMTGVPRVEIMAASASATPVCLIDYETGNYKRVASHSYYDVYNSNSYGTSYSLTNNNVTFPLQIMYNGQLATVVGNAPEETTVYYNEMAWIGTPAYRTPQYTWLLLKVENETTKNAPCNLPTTYVEPEPGPYTPQNKNFATYAVINITSREGHMIDTLTRILEFPLDDYYSQGIYVPNSNYVGQDSASFGNTHGNDIYLNDVRVGRWAGNSIDNRETIHIDMVALRQFFGTGYSTQYNAPKIELRAKYIDQTYDVNVLVDFRTYSDVELDPVTLEPLNEGFLLNAHVFEAPIITMDASPTLGDYLAQLRMTMTGGQIVSYNSTIWATAFNITGTGSSYTAYCPDGASWVTTVAPSGVTNQYVNRANYNFYIYGRNSALGNTQTSPVAYVWRNGAWTVPASGEIYNVTLENNSLASPNIALTNANYWTMHNTSNLARLQPITGTDIAHNIATTIPTDPTKTFKTISSAVVKTELLAYETSGQYCWNDPNSFGYVWYAPQYGTKTLVSTVGNWAIMPGSEYDFSGLIGTGVKFDYTSTVTGRILGIMHEDPATTYTANGATPSTFIRNGWLLIHRDPDP